MDVIAVNVVVKTAMLPINVTELQASVKEGVNQDGQEIRVIKVSISGTFLKLECTSMLVF